MKGAESTGYQRLRDQQSGVGTEARDPLEDRFVAELGAEGLELLARSARPLEVVHSFGERAVEAQAGELAKEQGLFALLAKGLCQAVATPEGGRERGGVVGNALERAEGGQHDSGRFAAPARQSRVAVGAVTDQREVVGDRLRRHAELLDHAGAIEDLLAL